MDTEKSPLIKYHHSQEIGRLNKGLDELFQEGKALRYASSLAKWYSERNKGTSYFLDKFKKDKGKPVISQLLTSQGVITDNEQILKEAQQFYAALYKKEEVLLPSDKLDQTPFLSPGDSRIMAEEISAQEIYSALKAMKPSSAPGLDGLTVKFYLHFWDIIKEDLINSFEFSFGFGRLSVSQRQGVIRLIPKKLRNLLLISNWRPIT